MIHHLSLGTNDLVRARAFYDPVMAVLGYRLMKQNADRELIYGANTYFLSVTRPLEGRRADPGHGIHIAFAAEARAMVESFYRVALAHGGKDGGEPGLRPQYDAHYFAAFVYDPDGHKLEAVTLSSR